jgi:hypothetical protein
MNDTTVIVHRVVYKGIGRRAKNYLITQGDAMLLPDTPILTRAVLGRVSEVRSGNTWRKIGPRVPAPRRERLLSFLLLSMTAASLEIVGPRFAQRLTTNLEGGERRRGWIKRVR